MRARAKLTWSLIAASLMAPLLGQFIAMARSDSTPATSTPARTTAQLWQVDANRFVRELDAAFNSRALDDYLGHFDSAAQPVFFTGMEKYIRALIECGRFTATSSVGKVYQRGEVAIAEVKTSLGSKQGSHATTHFLALSRRDQTRDDKGIVGLFMIEADPAAVRGGAGRSNRFSCKACNYAIDFGDDWLAVPRPAARSRCMESLWLVSLRHPIFIEAAVHIGDKHLRAAQALDNSIRSRAGQDRVLEAKQTQHWMPAFAIRDGLPEGMSCVRRTCVCAANQPAQMNMVTMGRLRYLVVVRGDVAAENRDEVEEVVNSFTILDPRLTAAKMVRQSIFAHTGKGELSAENLYRNDSCRISLQGPSGWRGQINAGPWRFELVFRAPKTDAGCMRVRAHRAYGGPWTRVKAEALIRSLTKTQGSAGAEKPTADSIVWQSVDDFETAKVSTGSDQSLVVAFRPDLLLRINCRAATPAATQAIDKAVRSLRAPK